MVVFSLELESRAWVGSTLVKVLMTFFLLSNWWDVLTFLRKFLELLDGARGSAFVTFVGFDALLLISVEAYN